MVPPELSEVIISEKRYGRIGKDTLVIMPFYNSYDYLSRHIELLKRQTFKGFDLLIVLSSVSDGKKVDEILGTAAPDYGIIAVKRKDDTGSAGGFYAGQKYALEHGYQYMVITDDDCLPVDAGTPT
jgi:rhamnopyranosyl-N-acetylglucosaminyl-diphospho-decaprenol beta-1,3/1,4-galactofuranosyltransferase